MKKYYWIVGVVIIVLISYFMISNYLYEKQRSECLQKFYCPYSEKFTSSFLGSLEPSDGQCYFDFECHAGCDHIIILLNFPVNDTIRNFVNSVGNSSFAEKLSFDYYSYEGDSYLRISGDINYLKKYFTPATLCKFAESPFIKAIRIYLAPI